MSPSTLVRRVVVVASCFVFAVLVWPTRYRYLNIPLELGSERYSSSFPVRVDRLSGRTEFLDSSGWLEAKPVEGTEEADVFWWLLNPTISPVEVFIFGFVALGVTFWAGRLSARIPLRPQPSAHKKEEPPGAAEPPAQQATGATLQVAELRRNLRQKVLHDEDVMARLVEFERQRNPSGTERAWLQAAIERWERDNR